MAEHSLAVDAQHEADRLDDLTDPRERLVRAAMLSLIQQGRVVLENGLSPEMVARTAGRSRRGFYDHFESKVELSELLFDEVFGMTDPSQIRLDIGTQLMSDNTGDLAQSISLMAAPPPVGSPQRVERLCRLMATALGSSDPYIRRCAQEFNARDRAVYGPIVAVLFESWGLELRPPWTPD